MQVANAVTSTIATQLQKWAELSDQVGFARNRDEHELLRCGSVAVLSYLDRNHE